MTIKKNVIDLYAYWNNDAINADLDKKRHKFAVLCANIHGDYNIASVVRNSNAFLSAMVYVYGNKKFDRRGTVGSHHYEHLNYIQFDLTKIPDDYVWVGIDNRPGAVQINDFVWPEKTLMCFGEEQIGIPPEVLAKCKHLVYIKQFGATRSLNVACASSIAMYDYTSKADVKIS